VLDLSKIEAGQFTLSLGEYSVARWWHVAVSPPLPGEEKKLQLKALVAPDLPPAWGTSGASPRCC